VFELTRCPRPIPVGGGWRVFFALKRVQPESSTSSPRISVAYLT
jgi:hypothetical protein